MRWVLTREMQRAVDQFGEWLTAEEKAVIKQTGTVPCYICGKHTRYPEVGWQPDPLKEPLVQRDYPKWPFFVGSSCWLRIQRDSPEMTQREWS